MYTSFYEPVRDLSDAQLGQLFRAIFADRMEEDSDSHLTDAAVRMAFRFIANQFALDDAKYNEVVLSRKEAGKAGAIKRWQKVADNSKNSKCHKAIASDSKNALNENDNENDNDINNPLTPFKGETPTRKRFVKPTREAVADYAKSLRYLNFNADAFCDFYDSKGWKVGSEGMKDWKAAVRNWQRNNKHFQPSADFISRTQIPDREIFKYEQGTI